MIYLDLILNLSFLVALSVISGFIDQRWPRNTRMGMVLQGVLFGGAGILGMLRPFQHGPGLIFDGRSVMVSLCALYFGPWSALIAGGATVACRLFLGGVGTIMGVMVIASSVMIGLLVHHHSIKQNENLSTWGLYVFGLAVHLTMIALMATLPSPAALTALRQVGLPIILLYPLATILVGNILSDQQSKIRFIADLQRTRQNLDTTLRSIADAVVSTDLKGDILLMNPVAETLTGWSGREALNRPIDDVFRLVEPNSNAPIPHPLDVMRLQEKSAVPAEHNLQDVLTGAIYRIAGSASPMHDNSGGIIGTVLVFRDVTEEYRAREALRQSEALLRIAGRAARLGGWIIHTADQQMTWSDEAAAIHEMPPGHKPAVAESVRFYAPEFRERIKEALNACQCNGTPFDEELQIITARGRRIWVRTIGEAVWGDADAVGMIQGSVQDITERKQVEEALRESEENYRKLFEDHAAVKLIIDPSNGHIVDANFAAADFYGWSREELRQMKVQQLNTFSPEAIQQEMDKVTAQKRIHFEFKHRCADGTIKDVAVFCSNIRAKDGYYLHSIVHDITERKKAEEENRKLQNQFFQAQKMESVGRLAGGVAHDFNNMLAVIIGRSDLALRSLHPNHPIYPDLGEIRKAATRSADLTRQLLAFARKQTIAPLVLDLNDTIESMLKMLRRMIGEDIDLLWQPGANLWPVKMDPAQIDQILANLVVNARDAVRGAGRLTIETANVEFDQAYCEIHAGSTPGQYAMLAVSDDGKGMDKETLIQVFEPFFTTKPPGQGTGLGLSTVYGIVKQNNGFINVSSEPNQGATFRIYMPRTAEREKRIVSGIEREPAYGTETVLLVEDEEVILELGQTILERYGYTILSASRPSKALSLAKQHPGPIHLLISDVVMPEMNGKDLRNAISVVRPQIKTLFISGYTADVIAHHGILEENVHYLQKPFSVVALAAKVREVLDPPGTKAQRFTAETPIMQKN